MDFDCSFLCNCSRAPLFQNTSQWIFSILFKLFSLKSFKRNLFTFVSQSFLSREKYRIGNINVKNNIKKKKSRCKTINLPIPNPSLPFFAYLSPFLTNFSHPHPIPQLCQILKRSSLSFNKKGLTNGFLHLFVKFAVCKRIFTLL